MYPVPKDMMEDVTSYYPPSDAEEKTTGFYYNRLNGYYEVWWPIMSEDKPELIASTIEESTLDIVLMEVLAYWGTRDISYLRYVTIH